MKMIRYSLYFKSASFSLVTPSSLLPTLCALLISSNSSNSRFKFLDC